MSVIELFHAAPAAVLRVTLRGGEDMNDSRYCVIFLPSSLLLYLLICFFLSRSSLSFPSLWCSAVVLFLVFISRVRVSAMDPQGVWPRVWEIPLFLIEGNRLRISLSLTALVFFCLFVYLFFFCACVHPSIPLVCVWSLSHARYTHPLRYTQVEEGDVCACH